MKVVVTGAQGFIGRYVLAELGRRGDTPVLIDRSLGSSVLDPDLPEWCVGADAVIHLAGILGTAELFDRAEDAIDINVKGTLRVLEACRKTGASYVGITMPQVWTNVYQATKTCARTLASAWHESYGLRMSHVMAYNAFGPGQKVNGVQKIVPIFAHRAWRGLPLPIWGDGTQTVDLVYAGDIARMLCDATAFGNDEVFEAGTGEEWTVNAVARLVLDITQSPSEIVYLPMRSGERWHTHLAARGQGWPFLGWHPKFDGDQFVNTVRWYRKERA